MKINIDDYVINKVSILDIKENSVGLITAINGESAMVLFIGENKITRVSFDNLSIIDIEKTGKGYDKKICNICHILKNTRDFEVNQTDAKGQKTTRPSCRECRKIINGVSISKEEKKRMEKIKPKKNSVFVCPICSKRGIVGVTAKLVKDHDHKTGLARDWICDSCNTGLGRFKDNIKLLENIIEYLKRTSEF